LSGPLRRAACIEQGDHAVLIERRTGIGGDQSALFKPHMDAARAFTALENRVGAVLNEFEELTIGITPGKDLDLGYIMLLCIAPLLLIGCQPRSALAFDKTR